MEVCRLRDTPIITFINKLDREGRPPIELLDEIEEVLKIRTAPVTWPIGMGQRLKGVYHIPQDRIYAYQPADAPRRTFAIISHPDAGKTTLTEKLLLFGGAIQMAGAVKGRKATRHATSDWMRLEQQRGISVTSSVMQFPFRDYIVNLLDTPGHEDFSEDTYRTLTAVDSALMVIDCAKGVE